MKEQGVAETNGASPDSTLVLMGELGYHLFLQNQVITLLQTTAFSLNPTLLLSVMCVTLRKVGTLGLTYVKRGLGHHTDERTKRCCGPKFGEPALGHGGDTS